MTTTTGLPSTFDAELVANEVAELVSAVAGAFKSRQAQALANDRLILAVIVAGGDKTAYWKTLEASAPGAYTRGTAHKLFDHGARLVSVFGAEAIAVMLEHTGEALRRLTAKVGRADVSRGERAEVLLLGSVNRAYGDYLTARNRRSETTPPTEDTPPEDTPPTEDNEDTPGTTPASVEDLGRGAILAMGALSDALKAGGELSPIMRAELTRVVASVGKRLTPVAAR